MLNSGNTIHTLELGGSFPLPLSPPKKGPAFTLPPAGLPTPRRQRRLRSRPLLLEHPSPGTIRTSRILLPVEIRCLHLELDKAATMGQNHGWSLKYGVGGGGDVRLWQFGVVFRGLGWACELLCS